MFFTPTVLTAPAAGSYLLARSLTKFTLQTISVPNLQLAPNLLQAVRAHYELALAPLAGCLGVSVSLLGLAATNRRELPTAAYLRLRPLAEALPPPWGSGPPPPAPLPDPAPALWPAPPLPTPAPEALRRRLAAQRHRLWAQQRNLAPLRLRRAQAEALQAVLPALAAALPPAEARAARWLPLLHTQVAERLGPAASAALALCTEVAQLALWLGEVGAGEENF